MLRLVSRQGQRQQAEQSTSTDRRIQCHTATPSSRRQDRYGRSDEDEQRSRPTERQVFEPIN